VIKRLLAYWLITYGTIRIAAGCYFDVILHIVAALSYFIEAFCFIYEYQVGNTLVLHKVIFVSIFSFVIGLFIVWEIENKENYFTNILTYIVKN
jgi:hypothetical protein